MLFNSIHYIFFFPLVVAVFFLLKKVRFRQIFLLAASWYFYAVWKPEYIFLLLISTLTDYFLAQKIEKEEKAKKRKVLLILSLLVNIGILFGFKYFSFFDHNVQRALAYFNIFHETSFENVLLPIGISFYTFQTISYTIDVYKREIEAERDFIKFALFVSFFPQLVAGPIERAAHILPQFKKKTFWDHRRITYGLKLMFWGFFQKLVIADSMAGFVDHVYAHPQSYHNLEVVLVTFFFAVQIYCDFSGYTDIARGTAKVLDYDLRLNFRLPYFANSFHSFWERWHISLSTWFRDYVYIPLGGNRVSNRRHAFNIMSTFLLSGFWHGAGWTFIIWGSLHGIYYLAEFHARRLWKWDMTKFHLRIIKTTIVFALVNLAWIFFRSESVTISWILIKNTFDFSSVGVNLDRPTLLLNLILSAILFIIHLLERKKDIVRLVSEQKPFIRWSLYYLFALIFLFFGNFGIKEFIYFQF